MQYILEFFDFFKNKKDIKQDDDFSDYAHTGKYPEHLKQKDRIDGDVYAVMTQEEIDRYGDSDPMNMVKNGYHFFYKNLEELEELERKYPVGGEYKGEKITQTAILNSKNIH